jgi:two-component system chemotaxis response regulator CheB
MEAIRSDTPLGVVVVAASYGGVEALRAVLERLPGDFPAPVLVVQHRSPVPDYLAAILRRRTALVVTDVGEEAVELGTGVYVLAPRTRYQVTREALLPEGTTLAPADDVMASAARAHGSRTCAVVLTGRREDGARGVRAVKRVGGYVIAQDPGTARAPEMPRAAMATGCTDLVLPLQVVGPALVAIVMAPGAIDMFPRSPRPWADISVP